MLRVSQVVRIEEREKQESHGPIEGQQAR